LAEQSFQNHTARSPLYLFLLVLNLALVISAIIHVVQEHSRANMLLVPVTFSLLLAPLLTRMYATKNQDRIIRLEETLRLQRLGASADGLTVKQLVGLRFASDGEVVALAARAKAEGLDTKQIKAAVVQWRADEHRV